MHWQKSQKEKSHQPNVLPTVRELLEEKRRCTGSTTATVTSNIPPLQTEEFNFSETGTTAGPLFPPAYPSWHADVSQPIISTEPCRYGPPNEFTPSDPVSTFNTTSMYPEYGYGVSNSETASLYSHHHSSFMEMRPDSDPSLFGAPATEFQNWPLSGASALPACVQPELLSIPYYEPTPSSQPIIPPQPIISSKLEEARRTIQSMEVNELLQRDDDGDTILHIYAAKGMREFVLAAAERIRPLNGLEAREHKGKTPLLVAVTANQPEVVSDLIKLGADVKAADFKGQTALHLAATYGYPGILQAILCSGVTVNVEARNFEGLTPLHCSVKSHNCTMRKLREAQSHTRVGSSELQTPAQDKLNCILILLQMGASIFTQDVKNSMSVLHLCVQDANLMLVEFFTDLRNQYLLDFLNMKAHGNTALHMAAGLQGESNQEEIVRLLLSHGADPTIRNMENEQPIHLLQASRQREQIKQMLKRGRFTPSSTHRIGSS